MVYRFWDLGPHACLASTLSTEPSLQPQEPSDAPALLLDRNASRPRILTHQEVAIVTLLLTWVLCF